MNDEYTIFPKGQKRLGEPLYTNRRGLKWLLEELFDTDPLAWHPDALLMHIDHYGFWEGSDLKVKKGHVRKEFEPVILEIQKALMTCGEVFVKYWNGDTEYRAVLKLVKTSEFRYDRFWRRPESSAFTCDGEDDRNQDDGNLNPDVHCGVFPNEEAALQWLLDPELLKDDPAF